MKSKFIFDYKTRNNEYVDSMTESKNEILNFLDDKFIRKDEMGLPKVSEVDAVRHFTNLSKKVYGVDNGIYPLGSCTMKYNPKINEKIASLDEFLGLHPYADDELSQGALRIIFELEQFLSEIGGMDATTLQPSAGAHGEFTGLLVIDAYHKSRRENRKKILVPNTAHGTNPASAAMLNMQVVEVLSDERGNVDINDLKQKLDENVAALMLTNPNTLGLFEENILEIKKLVHESGALLYYDGANLNALLGHVRPGDMGFDVMHFNLHKTFATPHGGGGPGSGPIAVKKHLAEFLPNPRTKKLDDKFVLDDKNKNSIGRVRSFYGNFSVIIKAYVYILSLGSVGLKDASKLAVLNANYLLENIRDIFYYPFGDRACWHEFVVSAKPYLEKGVKALDIAKRMIDYGVHPPTMYFPLTVKEALMFEPTETESKESIDELIELLHKISDEIKNDPSVVTSAPCNSYIKRVDEVMAAKNQDVALQR